MKFEKVNDLVILKSMARLTPILRYYTHSCHLTTTLDCQLDTQFARLLAPRTSALVPFSMFIKMDSRLNVD